MAADMPMQVLDMTSAEPGPDASAADREVLSRLEKGRIGSRAADGSVSVRRQESRVCLLYGPYWQLYEGTYRLSFECRLDGRPRFRAQPVLGVEVVVLNRIQHAWVDYTAEELAGGMASILFEVGADFSLESRNEGRFEFRFFHFGNVGFTITAVRLVRLRPYYPIAIPWRRWRLLGRLHGSAIGWRNRRGSLFVPRLSPTGCALQGAYLRLPRGRYRITLDGRAGTTADAARPVAAVEIIGNSRWREQGFWLPAPGATPAEGTLVFRHEFTRAALAQGGRAEFDVPDEFSMDSGVEAPFELRLIHLGNAGLRIDGLDLHRIGSEVTANGNASGAPALHPSRRKKLVIIGNCQAEIVCQGFRHMDSLSAQFDAKYHFVLLPANLYEFARKDLAECDLLLVQDLRDWDRFPLRDCVPSHIEPVRFPGIRFASLWPFDGWNGPTDREANRREAPNLRFPYLDGLLAQLRNEIPDREQRFQAYRSLECPGVVNYRRLHEFEERRLMAMDRKFDIEIGAYILEQFRKRRIFHTTVRPNCQIHDMLMSSILKAIGVRGRHPLPERFEATLRDPQIPVHPKVARDLGVKWADENTRYLDHGREVIWEEYIRSYIDHYG